MAEGGGCQAGGMPETPSSALALRSEVSADTVRVYLEEVDVPRPGPGEVLIRVEAAPINPSDLGLLFAGADLTDTRAAPSGGRPGIIAPLSPAAARAAGPRQGQALAAGNEGAGTVVATGPDVPGESLLGKVVAVAGGGMYAQYRVGRAADCLVMPDGVTPIQAASSFVNPLTALGMLETMRAEGHSGLVHTAAASNLGRMLARVCHEDGVALVNVVRSADQEAVLRGLGATHVCDSSRDDFMDRLTDAVAETSATIGFDAIGGGSMASRILTAMERAASAGQAFSRYGSAVHKQIYIYGGLDRGPTELSRSYGMAWGVGGWLLTPFLANAGRSTVERLRDRVRDGITTTFASSYSGQVSLEEMLSPEAVATYGRQATGGKYLVRPAG